MSTGPSDRWALIKVLIANWWPPIAEEDRVSPTELAQAEQRLGLTLPAALREWYQFAGRRDDLIGNTVPRRGVG